MGPEHAAVNPNTPYNITAGKSAETIQMSKTIANVKRNSQIIHYFS